MTGKTILHYKILEKLGQGGVGVVYKADDTKLKRNVAIKFLPHQIASHEEERSRFIIEAQAAAALNHPNIAHIYAIEEVHGEIFIVMEYIKGRELRDIIKATGHVAPLKAIDIALQIVEGLQAAHKKGVIHRDIKSSNIMIAEDHLVKLTDFGLAKIRGGVQITRIGTTMGTPAYMSPEQAWGEEVDHRSDIWSFGVVLYEMLTGRLPFRGDYDQAVFYSILNKAHEPVTNLGREIPLELAQLVDKTLQKEPAGRFQDTSTLLKELRFISNKLEFTAPYVEPARKELTHSIVVLPFTNLSSESECEYFCDGLAEELINALTRIKQLRVVARATAFSFKGEKNDLREIGKKLDVEAVLEGSVRKAGNRLRITTQLSKVRDGYQLWSEKFDRTFDDVFAIQDEITLTIVDKLKIKLLGEQRKAIVNHYTDDLEAYHLYLKGRYYSPQKKGIQFFEKAIAKDPLYAPAYSGLADIYSGLGLLAYLPPDKAFTKAKAAAEKALEIDNTLAEAYCSLGLFKFWLDNDVIGAGRDFQRAIDLDPGNAAAHYWFANLLVWTGEPERAIAEVMHAQKLDPLSTITQAMAGFIHYCARRFDEAIEYGRLALEIEPNSVLALYLGALPYKEKQMYAKAISLLEKAVDISRRHAFFLGLLGHVVGLSGDKSEARKILEELVKRSAEVYVSPLMFAWLYLGLDDNRLALEWFEKAFNEGYGPYHIFLGDSVYDGIRSTPQFRRILKKIGFEFWATQRWNSDAAG